MRKHTVSTRNTFFFENIEPNGLENEEKIIFCQEYLLFEAPTVVGKHARKGGYILLMESLWIMTTKSPKLLLKGMFFFNFE